MVNDITKMTLQRHPTLATLMAGLLEVQRTKPRRDELPPPPPPPKKVNFATYVYVPWQGMGATNIYNSRNCKPTPHGLALKSGCVKLREPHSLRLCSRRQEEPAAYGHLQAVGLTTCRATKRAFLHSDGLAAGTTIV